MALCHVRCLHVNSLSDRALLGRASAARRRSIATAPVRIASARRCPRLPLLPAVHPAAGASGPRGHLAKRGRPSLRSVDSGGVRRSTGDRLPASGGRWREQPRPGAPSPHPAGAVFQPADAGHRQSPSLQIKQALGGQEKRVVDQPGLRAAAELRLDPPRHRPGHCVGQIVMPRPGRRRTLMAGQVDPVNGATPDGGPKPLPLVPQLGRGRGFEPPAVRVVRRGHVHGKAPTWRVDVLARPLEQAEVRPWTGRAVARLPRLSGAQGLGKEAGARAWHRTELGLGRPEQGRVRDGVGGVDGAQGGQIGHDPGCGGELLVGGLGERHLPFPRPLDLHRQPRQRRLVLCQQHQRPVPQMHAPPHAPASPPRLLLARRRRLALGLLSQPARPARIHGRGLAQLLRTLHVRGTGRQWTGALCVSWLPGHVQWFFQCSQGACGGRPGAGAAEGGRDERRQLFRGEDERVARGCHPRRKENPLDAGRQAKTESLGRRE
eukprot:scaffold16844_cov119-Isochrysis_galbana.AAC.9